MELASLRVRTKPRSLSAPGSGARVLRAAVGVVDHQRWERADDGIAKRREHQPQAIRGLRQRAGDTILVTDDTKFTTVAKGARTALTIDTLIEFGARLGLPPAQ